MEHLARLFETAVSVLQTWVLVGVVWGLLLLFARRFKIQKQRFDPGLLRHELLWSALTLATGAAAPPTRRRLRSFSFASREASSPCRALRFSSRLIICLRCSICGEDDFIRQHLWTLICIWQVAF